MRLLLQVLGAVFAAGLVIGFLLGIIASALAT
jgi:hypothetical protein